MSAPSNMRKLLSRGNKEENIPLASMMDIFTNMLLFLIMTFSSAGILVTQVDQLRLPTSVIDTAPRSAVSIVVDSGQLSGVPGVYVEDKGRRTEMLDDGQVLLSEPTGEQALDPDAMLLPGLLQFLNGKAAQGRQVEAQYGTPFDGEITIQADAAVNYNSILKVLSTCGRASFLMTEFVVIKSK